MTVEIIQSGPYIGTGAVSEYDYDFQVQSKNDLKVVVTDTDGNESVLTVDADYTVNDVRDDDGTITLTSPLTTDYTMLITADYDYTQEVDVNNQGAFRPRLIERMADKLTFLIKQLQLVVTDNTATILNNIIRISALESLAVNLGFLGFIGTAEQARVSNLQVGQILATTGRLTENDGGAGQYRVVPQNTGVDDGGSYLDMSNGNQLELVNSDTVTVRQFGAVGDGVSDDSEQSQNALDYTSNVSFPDGEYVVSNLILNNNQNVTGTGSILFGGSRAMLSEGQVLQEVDFSVAVTDQVSSITVIDASIFDIGETVRLVSSIDCLSTDAGDMQLGDATGSQVSYFTEYAEIAGITGNVIDLVSFTVFDNYPLIAGSTTPTGRQISVVQKLQLHTAKVEGLTFIRLDNDGEAIRLNFNHESVVKNCHFINNSYSGASVFIKDSYGVRSTHNIVDLDADVPMNYLGNNPSARNYFEFNALMLVGSHNCYHTDNQLNNGAQNLDVSYITAPCVRCHISDNTISNARVNMLTTHSGSIDTTIQGNKGINCSRGPSLRSRGDRLKGNIILGSPSNFVGITTGSNTYGFSITEGFCQTTVVSGNYVEGFYRAFVYQDSVGTMPYDGFTLSNNTFAKCRQAMKMERSPTNNITYVRDTPCRILIENLTIRDITELDVIEVSGGYFHGIVFKNINIMNDLDSSSNYCFEVGENCKNLQIINCTLPDVGRALRIQDITDTVTLGPNTIENLNVTTTGNLTISGEVKNSWVWGALFVNDSGFTPFALRREFKSFTTVITELDVSTDNIIDLSNQSGSDVIISNLTGGREGQQLFFVASGISAGSRITFDNTGNIELNQATTLLIPRQGFVQFIKRSESGEWHLVVT